MQTVARPRSWDVTRILALCVVPPRPIQHLGKLSRGQVHQKIVLSFRPNTLGKGKNCSTLWIGFLHGCLPLISFFTDPVSIFIPFSFFVEFFWPLESVVILRYTEPVSLSIILLIEFTNELRRLISTLYSFNSEDEAEKLL